MVLMRIDVEGGWIEIRERLRVMDERAYLDFMAPYVDVSSGVIKPSLGSTAAHAVGRSAARLTGWSLSFLKSIPQPDPSFSKKVNALDQLEKAHFDVIWNAISGFEVEQDAQAQEPEEKNAPADGETVSTAI